MTDALFVTVDGGGNLPPALALAYRIVERGGTARFIGNEIQRARIETAGFTFQPIDGWFGYDASARRSTWQGVTTQAKLFADRIFARTAIESAAAQPTDVVVIDTLLYGALEGAVKAGLPVVQLVHMFSGFALRNAKGSFGLFVRMNGVDPVRALTAPKLTLVATRPEFDRTAMPHARHTGFFWQGSPVEAKPRETPRILVSYSTTAFPGQPEVLQRTVDGLGSLDAEVIVTTGPSIDPDSIRPAANTTIHSFLDHGKLLPETSLVIGHGGHSTASRALAYGVPMLVLPMHPLMDQPLVGKAIAEQGVGLTIPKRSTATAIREATVRLLGDERIRATAGELGASIRERDGAAVAVDALETFVGAPG
ncbi:UDP:flavonoid glycosyltransferase YjiC (YdhE family) [Cryobacterium mesophilum]|uniref:Glycosyltransferase n=1 Tax=Terrimesophilobacter mesophilus TaxID=433647 RepID=A0A4R8VCP7_9MICO|nr:glycosyltransferase [Terrimesophilobacter mesophilus]MBB5633144.1 UDP:flavonoid glycosyltransferase YjiC (YdhE family) [Terrimesophilobacter mesophilus]TFB79900.1 glycosyltransferase [Terrimesophilobacter mesophilus]